MQLRVSRIIIISGQEPQLVDAEKNPLNQNINGSKPFSQQQDVLIISIEVN